MKYRYNKPVYSNEQYKRWEESEKRHHDFMKKHTAETVKDYEINGYFIRCIQRKYDACMEKENEYGIQVWLKNPNEVKVEEVMEMCISNNWFNNSDEANESFKKIKEMCY